MGKALDLTGKTFGKLTVVSLHPEPYISSAGKPTRRWICKCECEKEIVVLQNALTGKDGTRSCGCSRSEALKKLRPGNTKICVVCGKEYLSPPSTNKTTCSPECLGVNRSKMLTGKKRPLSQEAIERHRTRPRSEKQKAQVPILMEAMLACPEGQRGPQNREAKDWVLRDPDGELHSFRNLLHWAREHAKDYFDMEPGDESANRIASGFRQLKRSMEGKLKRKDGKPYSAYSYKGWTLVSCKDRP